MPTNNPRPTNRIGSRDGETKKNPPKKTTKRQESVVSGNRIRRRQGKIMKPRGRIGKMHNEKKEDA